MTSIAHEGHDPHATGMQRELLLEMLKSQKGLTQEQDTFVPGDGTTLEILVKTNGGPAPTGRIDRITLHANFAAIEAVEGTSLLPYATLAGLRIAFREKSRGAGFMR
jgi:hypothetical protein